MKVGSLFSGVDGLGLGVLDALRARGHTPRIIWFAEADPDASEVLARHWPDVPNYGDVDRIDWANLERPDVLIGGFPCQTSSHAGRRAGRNDPRWKWPAFAAAIEHLTPRLVVIENVPGLLTITDDEGNEDGCAVGDGPVGTGSDESVRWSGFGDVLGTLARLGFAAEWGRFSSAEIGAPHKRDRLFVVAQPVDPF